MWPDSHAWPESAQLAACHRDPVTSWHEVELHLRELLVGGQKKCVARACSQYQLGLLSEVMALPDRGIHLSRTWESSFWMVSSST